MKYDWILDVLADLKSFADSNELAALAEQLEDTRLIATAEIVAIAEAEAAQTGGNETAAGTHSGGVGGRASA